MRAWSIAMPFTSSYEPRRRWLLTIATGRITLHDVRAHLLERVRRKLGGPELIDTTRAELAMGPSDLPQAVDVIREAADAQSLGPTAILVVGGYGEAMSMLLEALLAKTLDVRTFLRRDDAERWLTVGPFEHAR